MICITDQKGYFTDEEMYRHNIVSFWDLKEPPLPTTPSKSPQTGKNFQNSLLQNKYAFLE